MGLDSVEIILQIEESFNISVSDEEAASVRTVGQMYELILSKIRTIPDCMSSKTFYELRRSLTRILGIPRRSIRPATVLEEFFPLQGRRVLWQKFSDSCELEVPRLHYSAAWEQRFMTGSAIASALLLVVPGCLLHWFSGFHFPFQISLVFYWIVAIFLWIVLFGILDIALIRACSFLRSELPAVSMGNLTRVVLGMNDTLVQTREEEHDVMSTDQVWAKLVKIIQDQLQVEIDEIVPDARFVDDLGVC